MLTRQKHVQKDRNETGVVTGLKDKNMLRKMQKQKWYPEIAFFHLIFVDKALIILIMPSTENLLPGAFLAAANPPPVK